VFIFKIEKINEEEIQKLFIILNKINQALTNTEKYFVIFPL